MTYDKIQDSGTLNLASDLRYDTGYRTCILHPIYHKIQDTGTLHLASDCDINQKPVT